MKTPEIIRVNMVRKTRTIMGKQIGNTIKTLLKISGINTTKNKIIIPIISNTIANGITTSGKTNGRAPNGKTAKSNKGKHTKTPMMPMNGSGTNMSKLGGSRCEGTAADNTRSTRRRPTKSLMKDN